MSSKKQKKKKKNPPSIQAPPQKRHWPLVLMGSLFIVVGIFLAWERSPSSENPDWINFGPVIEISSETYKADLNVRCYVVEDGSFTFCLGAGEHLNDPCRAWVFITDLSFPYRWEIRTGEVENRLLSFENTNESANLDGTTSERDYPAERRFLSKKTGLSTGESIGWLNGPIYMECFTAVINPGEETSCEINFQMDPQHAVYEVNGNIIVRMPLIMSDRSALIYDMTASNIKELLDAGQYDMLPYFSNYLIDEDPLFETDLNITGKYDSEYTLGSNYFINNILPDPEQLLPSLSWTEELQWIPFLSFHDLRHDRSQFIYAWISGILIALGSGLATLPFSDWIQSAKRKQK